MKATLCALAIWCYFMKMHTERDPDDREIWRDTINFLLTKQGLSVVSLVTLGLMKGLLTSDAASIIGAFQKCMAFAALVQWRLGQLLALLMAVRLLIDADGLVAQITGMKADGQVAAVSSL